MAKKVNAPSQEGAPSNEVVETAVEEIQVVEETQAVEETQTVEETQVVDETQVVVAEVANEAEVIASNVFIAEDGTEVEFAVQHFIHKRRKYTVEEAVAEIPEALQELYERNSFIFKKL